jgi:tRNA(fMet)-specific endonuclease VapC
MVAMLSTRDWFRLEEAKEELALPIVAIEEQLRAWLAQVRRARKMSQQTVAYDRLMRLVEVLADWKIARFSSEAAMEFSRLQKLRLRIGAQDLKIAAIALSTQATLLSANLRHFEMAPGLKVQD